MFVHLSSQLHDRHRRISALEQEILRLRPLLLMQPYSSSRIKQTPNSQGPKTKPQDKGKRRDIDSLSTQSTLFNTIQDEANSYRGSVQKSNTANYPYGYQYKPDAPSSSSAPLRVSADPPSNSHPFLFEGPSASNATSQRRRSKDHSMPHKTKKQKHQRTSLMTSDAYAEHVLLAAQKIGRKRAALLTLQRITGREKESYFNEQDETKERDGQEKEVLGSANFGSAYYRASTDASPRQGTSGSGSRLPKTPKRSDCTISPNNNMNPVGVNTPPSTYVFVDASGTPVPNLPFHNPRSVTNTPSHLGAPVKLTPGIRSTSQSNPPTPMHSLLDAARMMDESNHKSSSKRRSHVDPESPTGKRRRISTEKQPSTRSSRITRVKSALDVLAESAAAVNDSTKADGSVGACASDNVSKVKANSTESGSEANYSSVSRSSTRTIRPSSLKLPVPPDEAKIATSSMTTERGAKSLGRHKSSAVHETRLIPRPSASSSLHRIASTGLRPVVVWGDRPVSDEDGDEDEDDGYSDAPQTKQHVRKGKVGVAHPRRGHGNNSLGYCPYPTEVHDGVKGLASGSLEVLESNHDSRTSPANVLDNAGTTHRDTSLLSRFQIVSAPETATPGTPHLPASSTHSLQHGTLEAGVQGTFAEGDEAITDVAADEDEDAEGEDEDDPESEIEINDRPSRFRSPPPPDPPFFGPGPGNEPPDDEHDADAEGEKDFDERGTYPAGQASKPRTETASGQHKDKSFWRIHFSLAAIHGTAVYFSTIRFCALSKEKVSFLQVKGPICPDIFPAHHGTEWLSKRGEQPTAILTQCVLLGLYTYSVYTY